MFRFTLILRSKYARRMNFYKPSYCNVRYRDRRTNYISFHPHVGVKARQTDKPFFIPHIWFHVRQTDGETTFHSLLIFESKADRGTNYSFNPSYWDPRKTDGQTEFHFAPLIGIKEDIQTDKLYTKYLRTTLHFTPQNGIHVRQTDKLSFISPLISESN